MCQSLHGTFGKETSTQLVKSLVHDPSQGPYEGPTNHDGGGSASLDLLAGSQIFKRKPLPLFNSHLNWCFSNVYHLEHLLLSYIDSYQVLSSFRVGRGFLSIYLSTLIEFCLIVSKNYPVSSSCIQCYRDLLIYGILP